MSILRAWIRHEAMLHLDPASNSLHIACRSSISREPGSVLLGLLRPAAQLQGKRAQLGHLPEVPIEHAHPYGALRPFPSQTCSAQTGINRVQLSSLLQAGSASYPAQRFTFSPLVIQTPSPSKPAHCLGLGWHTASLWSRSYQRRKVVRASWIPVLLNAEGSAWVAEHQSSLPCADWAGSPGFSLSRPEIAQKHRAGQPPVRPRQSICPAGKSCKQHCCSCCQGCIQLAARLGRGAGWGSHA